MCFQEFTILSSQKYNQTQMGSFPSAQMGTSTTQPIVASLLTPDSSAFQEKIKKMKFHNSVIELNRAADQTRQEVNKALISVKKNPFIFRSVKPKAEPKAQSKSINLLQIPQSRQRRVITQIEQKKTIHNSVIIKKEHVKYPEIKSSKRNCKLDGRIINRLKINSALSFITSNK